MARVAQDKTPLVWIDMEMSGLVPDRDRILEVAMVVTDADLNTIAEAPVYVLHQSDEVLEAMDSWNKSTHGRSGLVDKVRLSTFDEAEVESRLIEFLKPIVASGVAPLAGNTVHQDRRFMARYMPAFDAYLHYRIVDVSTLKELARRWRPDVLASLAKEGRHEALADVYESIEELRHYRRHFLNVEPPAGAACRPQSRFARPFARAFDGAFPRIEPFSRRRAGERRLENAIARPERGDLGFILPESDREPREVRCAERRGLRDARPHHRNAQQVRLDLHEEVVGGRPTADAQPGERDAGVGGHRFDQLRALEGDGFERGARQVRPRGSPRDPDDGAARMRVPIGSAQPRKRGHEVHAARIGHARGQRLDVGRVRDEPQAIAQPLHRGPGDEYAALERVAHAVVALPRHGREQPRTRGGRLVSRVHEQEAARSVRILCHSRLVAGLPEERGLLVARDSRDRNAARKPLAGTVGHPAARGHHSGKQPARNVENPEQLVIPVERVDIEEERSRGVARVGHVCGARRELPGEPCVDGAERELALARTLARPRNVLHQPGELGPREVGVEKEPRFRRERGFVPRPAPSVPTGPRPSALPEQRACT